MVFGFGGTPGRLGSDPGGSRWLSDARSVGTACRGGHCDVAVVAALQTGETEQSKQARKTPQACVVAVAFVCIGGSQTSN